MTGNNIFLVIMFLQAAVAYALQPSGIASPPPEMSVSGTTTTNGVTGEAPDPIPPVVPPGRGVNNENSGIILFSVTAPPTDTALPIQSTPDSVLANQIQNELNSQIPGFTPYGKQISSEAGHITIQGSVCTEADSRRITNIIKRFPGVKSVQNNLSVEEPGTTQ